MWDKLYKAIQKICIYFLSFFAKIIYFSPAIRKTIKPNYKLTRSYVYSRPRVFNPYSFKRWFYYGITVASITLMFFGGVIIFVTVIRFFICTIWELSICDEGDFIINILKLFDNILIAITIWFAGILLVKLPERLGDPEKLKKLGNILHDIDKPILSMVTIALSINFLVIVLIYITALHTPAASGEPVNLFNAGIGLGLFIIAVTIYSHFTHTGEDETRTPKDETHTPKDKTHTDEVSEKNVDAPPNK